VGHLAAQAPDVALDHPLVLAVVDDLLAQAVDPALVRLDIRRELAGVLRVEGVHAILSSLELLADACLLLEEELLQLRRLVFQRVPLAVDEDRRERARHLGGQLGGTVAGAMGGEDGDGSRAQIELDADVLPQRLDHGHHPAALSHLRVGVVLFRHLHQGVGAEEAIRRLAEHVPRDVEGIAPRCRLAGLGDRRHEYRVALVSVRLDGDAQGHQREHEHCGHQDEPAVGHRPPEVVTEDDSET